MELKSSTRLTIFQFEVELQGFDLRLLATRPWAVIQPLQKQPIAHF